MPKEDIYESLQILTLFQYTSRLIPLIHFFFFFLNLFYFIYPQIKMHSEPTYVVYNFSHHDNIIINRKKKLFVISFFFSIIIHNWKTMWVSNSKVRNSQALYMDGMYPN